MFQCFFTAGAHSIDERKAEILVRRGIGKKSNSGLLAHPRQGSGLDFGQASLFGTLERNGHGQKIRYWPRAGFDIEDSEQPLAGCRAQFPILHELRMLDGGTFAREPALRHDGLRQNPFFELSSKLD